LSLRSEPPGSYTRSCACALFMPTGRLMMVLSSSHFARRVYTKWHSWRVYIGRLASQKDDAAARTVVDAMCDACSIQQCLYTVTVAQLLWVTWFVCQLLSASQMSARLFMPSAQRNKCCEQRQQASVLHCTSLLLLLHSRPLISIPAAFHTHHASSQGAFDQWLAAACGGDMCSRCSCWILFGQRHQQAL
jgi:hypothetical protein